MKVVYAIENPSYKRRMRKFFIANDHCLTNTLSEVLTGSKKDMSALLNKLEDRSSENFIYEGLKVVKFTESLQCYCV
jgi:hypothetical protein